VGWLARGLVVLLVAQSAQAAPTQIWATWDLDLGTHPPPLQFILTVTSPTGAAVPPAMTVPYGTCQQPQHKADAAYCAPIGCPPVGTYDFRVQAEYAQDGLSAPSNVATCIMQASPNVCVCQEKEGKVIAPEPPPEPLVELDPALVEGLDPTPPPLPQQTEEGLDLQPVGSLPLLPHAPPIPAPWEDDAVSTVAPADVQSPRSGPRYRHRDGVRREAYPREPR
jgi:hypothetical protein